MPKLATYSPKNPHKITKLYKHTTKETPTLPNLNT